MQRNESVLWANQQKNDAHPKRPDYRGCIRLNGAPGHYYAIGLWKNQDFFNVWFTPWTVVSHTGVPPSADQSVKKVRLTPSRSVPGIFSGGTPKTRIELWPATCNGLSVFWLKLVPHKEVAR
jgi:hypothetical protein